MLRDRSHRAGSGSNHGADNRSRLLITGGAGFIGSALVRQAVMAGHAVVVVDKLTYASDLRALADLLPGGQCAVERVDICERHALERVFEDYRPDAVVHLAAESHVDRSIEAPAAFMHTNILGTYTLLETARAYWNGLTEPRRRAFRLHHVSTDEVFGDLGAGSTPFSEHSPYRPSSPYAASKAGADHLVRAWQRTYDLPTLVSSCCNNYGPYQFQEKLIPRMIQYALAGWPLPVYGHGEQIREWLFVEDHARALLRVLDAGEVGATYNLGSGEERTNLEVIHTLCDLLEELAPRKPAGVAYYRDLIARVADRPGHDQRYAIDSGKARRQLGWRPRESFDSGMRKTVAWYLANTAESTNTAVLSETYAERCAAENYTAESYTESHDQSSEP